MTVPFGPLTLYMARICPFAQRITIALHELGLLSSISEGKQASGALEVVEIDLQNKPDYYLRDVNPRGKVPALRITHSEGSGNKKDEVLAESALIAELLLQANRHPAALMRPEDALRRFRGGLIVDTLGNQFIGPFFKLLGEKDTSKHAELRTKLLDGIKAVQAVLQPVDEGAFALGTKEPTLPDILSASFLVRIVVNEHWRDFKVPRTEEYARFNAWFDALKARESVRATTISAEELVEGYRGFALG